MARERILIPFYKPTSIKLGWTLFYLFYFIIVSFEMVEMPRRGGG